MKQFLFKIIVRSFSCFFALLGIVFSFFTLPRLKGIYTASRVAFYTHLYRRRFKSFGKSSIISGKFLDFRGAECIEIGENSKIGEKCFLTAWSSIGNQKFSPIIKLGNNSNISSFSHVTCVNKIIIGNNVCMGRHLLISDNSHGKDSFEDAFVPVMERPLFSQGPVIIEDNVWIGEYSCILPNVKIGRGTTIGAGSIVRNDIPPYSYVFGNPAKVIGFKYTPEEMYEIEKKLYPEDQRYSLQQLQAYYDKYYSRRIKDILKFVK